MGAEAKHKTGDRKEGEMEIQISADPDLLHLDYT
jgi:hypothetical protein